MDNRDLIRKIYLPRELFPVAIGLGVGGALPAAAGGAGRRLPDGRVAPVRVPAGWPRSLIFVMVAVLATGLGLLFGAANVYFRDSENIVDMILMVATWASPVLYVWTMVEAK